MIPTHTFTDYHITQDGDRLVVSYREAESWTISQGALCFQSRHRTIVLDSFPTRWLTRLDSGHLSVWVFDDRIIPRRAPARVIQLDSYRLAK